jgi:hypothetical protein
VEVDVRPDDATVQSSHVQRGPVSRGECEGGTFDDGEQSAVIDDEQRVDVVVAQHCASRRPS